MAFLFDSLCTAVLFVAAILSWDMAQGARPGARTNLRFAAAMLTAFCVAQMMPSSGLAFDVAFLTPSLAAAAAMLALLFPRRASVWFSCLILIAGLATGLLAAFQAAPVLALGYQAGMALAIFVWGLSRLGASPHRTILANLGATSLLFGAMAVMNGSLGAAMLFFATFLLLVTRASQTAIADQGGRGQLLISSEHI